MQLLKHWGRWDDPKCPEAAGASQQRMEVREISVVAGRGTVGFDLGKCVGRDLGRGPVERDGGAGG
jgi:hypothetical protein